MAAIFLIPALDYTGGVRTVCGAREYRYATIDDLKIALWKAHIYPERHQSELQELSNGMGVRLSVTEAQRNAFYHGFFGNESRDQLKSN